MKPLTTEDMRVIREALIYCVLGQRPLDERDRRHAQTLLQTQFPCIPAARVLTRPTPEPKPITFEEHHGPNVMIFAHEGGYLIKARKAHPWKWYAVEWYADHHLADAARTLLENDDKERFRVIREAKQEEHYTHEKPAKARERAPREKFDFSLLTVDTVVEGL